MFLWPVLMIGCGAFGSLTVGNVKWVWWFFGMCWFMHIIFALGKSWAESAKARSSEAGTIYGRAAGLTVIAWFCYPIIWVFAEGFGNFSVTFEVCVHLNQSLSRPWPFIPATMRFLVQGWEDISLTI
jgi:bacteriorhodopsin